MMEHTAMIELMQQLLDGGLDPTARGRLDAHVATCAECAQQWAALQVVHTQLLAAPPVQAAPGFTARVMGRLALEREQLDAIAAVRAAPSSPAFDRQPPAAWHAPARGVPVLPFVLAAGLLALVSAALALAPLAGLANLDALESILSDSLGLLSVGIAWLNLLLTFITVALQAAGDGLLLALFVLGLGMTLVWIRLVAGAEFVGRQTYINGGV